MGRTILILTAPGERQAEQFRCQLGKRERLGLLYDIDEWRVVPDPPGRKVGSGGSTIHVICELARDRSVKEVLDGQRVLVIHAGGESRRMPAYAACGKPFCPIPGEPFSALPLTLFDAQIETYLRLPENSEGQVVIFAGDVLLRFDPGEVDLSRPGLTGVAAKESAQEASGHGVYAKAGEDGEVERFVQKLSTRELARCGALDRDGRAAIDLGIMSFTADFAESLLDLARRLGNTEETGAQRPELAVPPLDFYTEVACCLGSGTAFEEYAGMVTKSGLSTLSEEQLRHIWDALHGLPFHCSMVEQCDFLHFGTLADYLESARRLNHESGRCTTRGRGPVVVGCDLAEVLTDGAESVIEGCNGGGKLELAGRNLIVGAEVRDGLKLNEGICLDVLPGRAADGSEYFFCRLYGIDDTFKGSPVDGTCTFLNEPVKIWLRRHRVRAEVIWPGVAPEDRSLWNAKLFPRAGGRDAADLVLWMQESDASEEAVRLWVAGKRWSMEEMARLADGERFWRIREDARRAEVRSRMPQSLDEPHPLTPLDVAYILDGEPDGVSALRALAEGRVDAHDPLRRARLLHTVGSALEILERRRSDHPAGHAPEVGAHRGPRVNQSELKAAALEVVRECMVASAERSSELPARAIMKDQIVWGRAPVRLDLAGGWTDTPPFSLEHGGTVVNAAVDLNGQPPIQVFARMCEEPHIRLNSIDLGLSRTITNLESLLDYESPEGAFSIAQAALALCGFSPELRPWPEGATLGQMLERFGGGIEVTTLCAVPKGSGLGTSSILGAVLIATINRMLGLEVPRRQLFHQVLVLEQMLTTGGGWQDQIGGAVGGLKLITTSPGMVPEPVIHWLPTDSFCPTRNGGRSLLYYTGIVRLARNILQNVVGRYLDRDREALRALSRLKAESHEVRDALERRDGSRLGAAVARVWELNRTIDPGTSNRKIEELMRRIRPYSAGAKLLGAGGGGFVLIICPDPEAAARCRADLESEPLNELARFFDFQVSERGLEVTVS